jgi:hypothetical protein
MRKMNLITLLAVLLFTAGHVFSQDDASKIKVVSVAKGETVAQLKYYTKLPILSDLGVLSESDFGASVDAAVENANVAELTGLAVQLKFYEDYAGTKSKHLNSTEVIDMAISVISHRAGAFNQAEFDLVKKASVSLGASKSTAALTTIKAEMDAQGMGDATNKSVWTQLCIDNRSGENVNLIVNGYNRGAVYCYDMLSGSAYVEVWGRSSGICYFSRQILVPGIGYTIRVW